MPFRRVVVVLAVLIATVVITVATRASFSDRFARLLPDLSHVGEQLAEPDPAAVDDGLIEAPPSSTPT